MGGRTGAERFVFLLSLLWLVVAISPYEGRADTPGAPPGEASGTVNDTIKWEGVRRGDVHSVSIPDEKAGILIQSEGDNWRRFRNGPLTSYGAWFLWGVVVLLGSFYAFRGRIMIDGGPSGTHIERFGSIERFAHWLLAGSFIILALTGLNMLYGRYLFVPLLGREWFSVLAAAGKYAHNYVAFAFMAGLVLVVVLWVRDNLPRREDLVWLARGGGFFSAHSHPPAHKFNAGQKIFFWLVVLSGVSLSVSGLLLLVPFRVGLFGPTFAVLNTLFGLDLPTGVGLIQEVQLSHVWHAALGLVTAGIVVAHIYIGSIGMEGAFDAMGTGHIDKRWASNHHSLWVRDHHQETSPEQGNGARVFAVSVVALLLVSLAAYVVADYYVTLVSDVSTASVRAG